MRYFPFLDLKNYRLSLLSRDVLAACAVIFLCVPQGVAYAIMAGLPPATGLYAAAFPTIVGSFFRSSRHVITGPTNALSLLVGGGIALQLTNRGTDPVQTAVTLAFIVGALQFLAGIFRLGALVDYISIPVLRGYITGAAVLIAVGQLANVTGTAAVTGSLPLVLWSWSSSLPQTNALAVGFAFGTAVLVMAVRRFGPRVPGPLLVMLIATTLVYAFDLTAYGLRLAGDQAATPASLPPLTVPAFALLTDLLPLALACTVLSLVESTSSARAIASHTGQRLDITAELTGQGLANLTASLTNGYPVSGSLTRSALNEQTGAQSRLAGALSGVLMLLVLLAFGPFVDYIPIASLAGLLFIVAVDLIDWSDIHRIMRGTLSDRVAFVSTLLGTWFLSLDKAIYLGVGISLVLFLRRARLLTAREMMVSDRGRFREVDPELGSNTTPCTAIRIMNLTGPLFFAAAGELQSSLDRFASDARVRVLILRIRQAQDLDVTTATVLEAGSSKLKSQGKTLLLLGMRPTAMHLLESTGVADRLDGANLFPAQAGWFTAMEAALRRALALTGAHECGSHCPFAAYIAAQDAARSTFEQ